MGKGESASGILIDFKEVTTLYNEIFWNREVVDEWNNGALGSERCNQCLPVRLIIRLRRHLTRRNIRQSAF